MLGVFQRFTAIFVSVVLVFASIATQPVLAEVLTELYILDTEAQYNAVTSQYTDQELIVPNKSKRCTDGRTDGFVFYINDNNVISFENDPSFLEQFITVVMGKPKMFPDGLGSAETKVIPLLGGLDKANSIFKQEDDDNAFLAFSPDGIPYDNPYKQCSFVNQHVDIIGETELIEFIQPELGIEFQIPPKHSSPQSPKFVVVAQTEYDTPTFNEKLGPYPVRLNRY